MSGATQGRKAAASGSKTPGQIKPAKEEEALLEKRYKKALKDCGVTEAAIKKCMAEGNTREDAIFLLMKGAGW